MTSTTTAVIDEATYKFDTGRLLTPALVIYPHLVRHNIQQILRVMDGDANRWRPHLKTVKAVAMMRLLVEAGVTRAKCATTGELKAAIEAGFRDVLVSFSHKGANAARIAQIAREYPAVRVSALVESPDQVAGWTGTPVGLFIDINPGMDRTGMDVAQMDAVADLAAGIMKAGIDFRGLHFYDGHSTQPDMEERTAHAHARYDGLMNLVAALETKGIKVTEVVTTGTPALPCALSYKPFRTAKFLQQVSPGTVVYGDATSIGQLPAAYDLRPAVAVVSRVVSHPLPTVITCDAGHKSVSVDSGVPNCVVAGHPDFVPMKPSEEHLPIRLPGNEAPPALGSTLYLVPRHVCPTVNLANYAVLVEPGKDPSVIEVTARGHERPL